MAVFSHVLLAYEVSHELWSLQNTMFCQHLQIPGHSPDITNEYIDLEKKKQANTLFYFVHSCFYYFLFYFLNIDISKENLSIIQGTLSPL